MQSATVAAAAGGVDGFPRVTLGPGAPEPLAEFISRAAIEVVPLVHRHRASLYVDFVGARPPGIEVLSIDLEGRASSSRAPADLVTDSWQAAACLVISNALKLKPPLVSSDAEALAAIRGAVGVAPTQVPVVITGEIGSGKYNLACLIHHVSRCPGPLQTVNCGSFDEADPAAPGEGAAAMFLDELGELGDAAQVKLLRLLQDHERLPRLDPLAAPPSLRVIAATNRSLPEMVERGDFRRELFWRLNVFSLSLPPLRQRAGDVAMLARYFLRRANPRRGLAPAALKVLSGYAFPGNVLELDNLITRLAIAPLTGGGHLVDIADIRRYLVAVNGAEVQVSGWKASREEARREMILRTIAAAGGNRLEAAHRLGITPRALQYHITKAGLSRPRHRPPPANPPELVLPDTPPSEVSWQRT